MVYVLYSLLQAEQASHLMARGRSFYRLTPSLATSSTIPWCWLDALKFIRRATFQVALSHTAAMFLSIAALRIGGNQILIPGGNEHRSWRSLG